MDSTDVLIFCEMSFKYFDYSGGKRRPSSKGIGEKLGLDERTVRLRIRKMEREGFIRYYQTIPNLRLLGQPLAYLFNFQTTDITTKQRAIAMIREADDIIDIADYLGESFGVTISAASEEDAQQTIAKLSRKIGVPRLGLLPPRQFPSLMRTLGKLDWELVRSLRYDALKTTREVARETGSTHRMADYAIGRLFESQALLHSSNHQRKRLERNYLLFPEPKRRRWETTANNERPPRSPRRTPLVDLHPARSATDPVSFLYFHRQS